MRSCLLSLVFIAATTPQSLCPKQRPRLSTSTLPVPFVSPLSRLWTLQTSQKSVAKARLKLDKVFLMSTLPPAPISTHVCPLHRSRKPVKP